MPVYKILPDSHYQELDLLTHDLDKFLPSRISSKEFLNFPVLNLELKSWWKPFTTGFKEVNSGEEVPDITTWLGSTLVLNTKAKLALSEILMRHGEFLPIFVEGEEFYIFNCMEMVGVDEDQSKLGEFGIPQSIVFMEKEIAGLNLFKTLFDSCADLYCSEKFKQCVEEEGLRGISFQSDLTRIFDH